MNRRAFIKSTAVSSFFACNFACAAEKATTASDGEILAQCKERIERHRKTDSTSVLRDNMGKPIANASVRAEQQRHEFLFGSNIFRWGRLRDPALEDAYRNRFAALLNYATMGFYWASYEPEKGKPLYAYTDQVIEWAQQHHITPKGHPLVWDYADPKWLPKDFTDIRELSKARVREIIARYRGRIDIWDVVNEPTHLGRFNTRTGEWAMSMGAVPYVTENLKVARAANPKATLLVNDYRVDPPFARILEQLRENGKLLFDTVGIQSHMHGGVWTMQKVWEVCDRYGKFGVPIHFTEATIVSGRKENEKWTDSSAEEEERQTQYVSNFYTSLFAHPAVQAITWWDFSDNGAWMGAPSGWLRKDMSPKPVYDRLLKLIRHEWWTQTQGRTNGQGEIINRGFAGDYEITVTLPNGQIVKQQQVWKTGHENRYEIKTGT